MANAKDIKLRLRSHVELRMRDFREAVGCGSFYADVAYGAVWAASFAEAITDNERATYLNEIRAPEKKAA